MVVTGWDAFDNLLAWKHGRRQTSRTIIWLLDQMRINNPEMHQSFECIPGLPAGENEDEGDDNDNDDFVTAPETNDDFLTAHEAHEDEEDDHPTGTTVDEVWIVTRKAMSI